MKRGQITAIIIIGLLILIAVASYFYVRNYILKSDIERELEKAQTIPEQIRPVYYQITSCLTRITEDDIRIMSMQGGYLTLPTDKLPITPLNPFSNQLEILPGLSTPYWFYETSNGVQKYQIPTNLVMERQIASSIKDNFIQCLYNITTFTNQGYSFKFSENITAKSTIQDTKVLVEVDSPINIDYKGEQFTLNPHVAKFDTSFGKLYNSANTIITELNKNNFFEEKTIDMLAVYSEIPYSGISFDCKPNLWSKQDINRKLRPIISGNIQSTILKGSSSVQIKDSSKYFILDTGVQDIEGSFSYSPSWPLVTEISPSEGDVLKTDVASKKISESLIDFAVSSICINSYNFIYDIKYPILITLNDANGNFQFATMVIIKRNQPKEAKIVPQAFEEKPLICENKAVGTTIYTKTISLNGEYTNLPGVDISYKCVTTTCPIGSSELDQIGEASISADFPPCVNGFVIGEKEGYHTAKQMVSTNYPSSTTITLEPFYIKKVNVKLIDKDTGLERDSTSEQIILNFENKDNGYSTMYLAPSTEEIKLTVGKYEISSYVIKNSTWPIEIKKETIQKCVSVPTNNILGVFINEQKCFDTEIPAMKLDQTVIGGAKFEFEITQERLLNDNPLIIYTMVDKVPSTYKELANIYTVIDQNAKHPYFKYPN